MKYIKQEKLNKIKLNKDNIYVAIDFDRTITSNNSDDSWDATGKCLGREFKNRLEELYQKYRPIELSYKISFKEKNDAMERWYKQCMDLYYKYNLTKEKLENSIEKSNLIFRKGAKQFLEQMYKTNVPVVILSAGIGNVIKKFLNKSNCYYENIFIISNFIEFDEKDNMKRFEGDIIHTLNKNIKGYLSKDFEENIKNKKYGLLFGDVIEDKKMVPEEQWNETISVGFLNENIDENLEEYKKNFDIVLTKEDATFEIINKIIFNDIRL